MLLSAGVFIVGFANSIGFMFLGLAVFAAGFGAGLSMLSVLTGFATAEFRARLYTLLSIIEDLTRLISTPLIQNLWAKAIGWDGVLLGLPFIVLSCLFLMACPTAIAMLRSNSLGMSANAAKLARRESALAR